MAAGVVTHAAQGYLDRLIDDKLVAHAASVCLILYLASASAYRNLKEHIREGWAQVGPEGSSDSSRLIESEWRANRDTEPEYFDPHSRDERKAKGAARSVVRLRRARTSPGTSSQHSEQFCGAVVGRYFGTQ
jgi:hypothetical protein